MDMMEPARLLFQFDGAPAETQANYVVVDTDYNCFALIYSCAVVQNQKLEFSWIFSRAPTLSETKTNEIKNFISIFGVDSKKFIASDQSCFKQLYN